MSKIAGLAQVEKLAHGLHLILLHLILAKERARKMENRLMQLTEVEASYLFDLVSIDKLCNGVKANPALDLPLLLAKLEYAMNQRKERGIDLLNRA